MLSVLYISVTKKYTRELVEVAEEFESPTFAFVARRSVQLS